ncbi:hypothetical protein BBW65_04680 [Helicobacter enhydrae]|uniref:GGDEF domain-containing protein n=1 Tax=Helicobacter enhydrae TaxID=222136 RepID=A0A1B1U5S0_9HELI|nr:hypothetical protein [Helicobacter enhydrae]ANV98137.1 hypothetical protein BBW65_04680 [Helicobacter enhydrae]
MSQADKNFLGEIEEDTRQKNEKIAHKTNEIAKNVISELEKQDIPLFPQNFEAYFDKLANDTDDPEYKEFIQKIASLTHESETRLLEFEISVRDGFKNMKSILEITKDIYQNLILAQQIVQKRSDAILAIENPSTFQNAVQLFVQDLENVQKNTQDQLMQMREVFERIAKNIQAVNENTLYDTQYGVYNKRYFVSLCMREKELLDQISKSSTFVAFGFSKHFLLDLKSKEFVKIAIRSAAKLFLKYLKGKEPICYYGNGRFVVFVKYIESAEVVKKMQEILDSAKESSIFLNGDEVKLKMCAGVFTSTNVCGVQECIANANRLLDEAFCEERDYKAEERM